MKETIFVGVDISKLKFDATILLEKKSQHQIFDNDLSGCKAFLTWLTQHTDRPWVCMEATGHYSELLADFLAAHELHVSVINPLQIKHFAKAKLCRNKNDKLDSKTIAEFGKIMKPKLYIPRSSEQKQLREHVRLISLLKKQRAQLKTQLESATLASSKKNINSMLKLLSNRINKLEETLAAFIKQSDKSTQLVKLLRSIQGVGLTSAIALLAYLPDISLFRSAKQLAAFIGVSPKQRESGQFKGKTCMSKFGDPTLRAILYMPALTIKKQRTHLKDFIQRLEKKGLKPMAIVGALMRKLAHIIFGVLKNNQPFNPDLI